MYIYICICICTYISARRGASQREPGCAVLRHVIRKYVCLLNYAVMCIFIYLCMYTCICVAARRGMSQRVNPIAQLTSSLRYPMRLSDLKSAFCNQTALGITNYKCKWQGGSIRQLDAG